MMFSTAYKLLHGIWGTPEEDSSSSSINNVEESATQYPSTEVSYGTVIDGLNAPQESSDQHLPTKQITGTITHVFGDYGLIDGDIYFNLSAVLDRACPVVGASVQAVVNNRGDNGLVTKQASSVIIVNYWFDSADELKEDIEDVVIGKVTSWDKRTGCINEHIPFTKDALPYDFIPYRGDWVKATTLQSITTGETIAKSIKPLRERFFSGKLTHWYPGYGFVDGTIYFHFNSCDGFRPQKGDWLAGVAIESDQNRGKWRGMKIHKKSRPEPESIKTNVEDVDQPPQVKWKEERHRNKCGVVISEIPEVREVHLDGKLQLTLDLKKTLSGSEHVLREVKVSCCAGLTSYKMFPRGDPSSVIHPPVPVHPGSEIRVEITLCPRYLGRTSVVATFQFGEFQIGREILVMVLDPAVGEITRSLDPPIVGTDSKKQRVQRWGDQLNRQREGKVMSIPGQRPHRSFDYNVPVKLPGYPVSKELQTCIMNKRDVRDVRPVLTEPLMMETYSRKFSALLHLEEIQMDIDIRMFDMERVSMKPWREFLALEVPGLAEGRPSVLVGDKVILTPPDGNHNLEFDGYVHEVHGEHVLLKFNPAFHESYQAERYNVRFTFSRTPLRRCHQACEFAVNLGTKVLFPASSKSRPPQVNVLLNTQNVYFNRHIDIKNIVKVIQSPDSMTNKIRSFQLPIKPGEDRFVVPKVSIADLQEKNFKKSGKRLIKYFNKKLNPRQKAAVVRILQGESRPVPYILFGPPGTGKTITVVEAILQVHHSLSHSRVLACTPSNSAADLLAERLHASGQVTSSDMVRLNAFRRQEEDIPEVILPYCAVGDDLALVARHRIIVATCSTAGSLYQLGLRAGHFTHVFLDEAGQATEPEAMVVVSLSVGLDGQSILAGDPRQLGPVLRSTLAKEYGLEQSLLERLMDREAYQRDERKFRDHGCYDPLLVTKLVDNYRSHPALLRLPSRLFYHGELEPRADRTERESLSDWKQLPNQDGFPLIFHGIKGEDLKEGNSPSWFNPVEAVQAVKYLQALLAEERYKLSTEDVGIITPYRKQVEKINLLLTSLCIQGVKVGSVEEFQGQERMAIIISTVRSDESLLGFDRLHQLGFVSSPKRFNVAITRPKALLIVVGNPHVLATDSKWRALLQYCSENGGYVGCDLPDFSQYETREEEEEDKDTTREDVQLTAIEGIETSKVGSISSTLQNGPHLGAARLVGGGYGDGRLAGNDLRPKGNAPPPEGNNPQQAQISSVQEYKTEAHQKEGGSSALKVDGSITRLLNGVDAESSLVHGSMIESHQGNRGQTLVQVQDSGVNARDIEGVERCEKSSSTQKRISPGKFTSDLQFRLSRTSPDYAACGSRVSLMSGLDESREVSARFSVEGSSQLEGDILELSDDVYGQLNLSESGEVEQDALFAQLTASPVVNTYSPTSSTSNSEQKMFPSNSNDGHLPLQADNVERFEQDFRRRGGWSERSSSISSTSSSTASSEVEFGRERRGRRRRDMPPTPNHSHPTTPKTKLACNFQGSPKEGDDPHNPRRFVKGKGRGLIMYT